MRFDARNVPPADNSPLPDGEYEVRVESANEVENKNRTGCYLELVLVVVGPSHQGRKLWARYTTQHQESEKAVQIGQGEISAAMRSLNKMAFNHESELNGCVGRVRVGRDRNDASRNEVKGWVLPSENKGAPTYSNIHQRTGAEHHDIRGERTATTQGAAPAPRVQQLPDGRPLPPSDFDIVPF
jgi:hypothetical protein